MSTPMPQMNPGPTFQLTTPSGISQAPSFSRHLNMNPNQIEDHQNELSALKMQLSQLMDAREQDKHEMERLKTLETNRAQKGMQLLQNYQKQTEEVKMDKSRTLESLYLESSGNRGFGNSSIDEHRPNVIRNIEDMSEDEITMHMHQRDGSKSKRSRSGQRRGSMNDALSMPRKQMQKESVLRANEPEVNLRQISQGFTFEKPKNQGRSGYLADTAAVSKYRTRVDDDKGGELSSEDDGQEMIEQEIFELEMQQLKIAAKGSGGFTTQYLMGESREIKRIHTRDMSRLFKSKQSIYDILVIEGQYYLPPIEECTIDYLRDLFSGKKKYLLNSQVKMIRVPKMPELTAQSLIKNVAKDSKLRLYFPDLVDSEGQYKTINRQYLFNIINTLKPSFFPDNIAALMKLKKEHEAEKKQTYIEVKSHIYNLIVNSNLVSRSSRGKAVHLLSAAIATKKRNRPDGKSKRAERVVFDLAVGLDGSVSGSGKPEKSREKSDLLSRITKSKAPIVLGGGDANASQSTYAGKDTTMNAV